MTELIFLWLEKIGFAHPLHSPVTHVPMGMAIGGCVFACVAHFAAKPALFRTALHCYVLALIAIVPTMFLGYMDWQHFYQGAWSPYIMAKIPLAVLLLTLCGVNVRLLSREGSSHLGILIGCGLSLIVAGLLGFFGGELMYGQ